MKKEVYYLDTSIWLDFFEERDEPNFPKSIFAKRLLQLVISQSYKIVYSDLVLFELQSAGYTWYELNTMFKPFTSFLVFVEATVKQVGRAKDVASRRNIPKNDVLHSLIARENKAVLVTFDQHFQELCDIVKVKNTKELTSN